MKAENSEYRKRARDYDSLHNQYLELEQRFRLLHDEKEHADTDSKNRDGENYKRIDMAQTSISIAKTNLDDKQRKLNELGGELLRLKDLAGRRTDEIALINRDISVTSANNGELIRTKNNLEQELAIESNKKRDAQLDADHLANSNSKLLQQNKDIENIIHENELEIYKLRERLDLLNKDIGDTNMSIRSNEASISTTVGAKQSIQREIDNTIVSNSRLQDENNALDMRARDLSLQLDQFNKKYQDTLVLIDGRSRDLQSVKDRLIVTESRGTETRDKTLKFQRDNQVLQSLLDKYRDDAETHKRLRDQEIAQKFTIEEEKKRLEREVLSRDIEARSAKKELEIVQVNKNMLADNHMQLNSELDALKNHAELLESQNNNVSIYLIK